MSQYRLHIDIPLGTDEQSSKDIANSILQWSFFDEKNQTKLRLKQYGVEQVNYRLGYDEDRQKSNYFVKNENGHVSNKKTKILINPLES
jgi:hypothetical protein